MYVTAQQRRCDGTDTLKSLVSLDREIAEGKGSHRRTPCSHMGERPKKATQGQMPQMRRGPPRPRLSRSRRRTGVSASHRGAVWCSRPARDQLHGCHPRADHHCGGGPVPAASTHKTQTTKFTRKWSARNWRRYRESHGPSTRLLPHKLLLRSRTCEWGSQATRAQIPPKESLMGSRTRCQGSYRPEPEHECSARILKARSQKP